MTRTDLPERIPTPLDARADPHALTSYGRNRRALRKRRRIMAQKYGCERHGSACPLLRR